MMMLRRWKKELKKKLKEKQIVAMYDEEEIRQGLDEYIANDDNNCLGS